MAMRLSDQFATRGRSIDFQYLGMLLPNPDPVLKARGIDIKTYRDMRSDALIGSCVRRRKSAVKALSWGLDRGQAASRVTKNVQAMLDELDLEQMIGQAMDAAFYGYQPMEVMWEARGSLWVPVSVEAHLPEWFGFDDDNQLRFKTKQSPMLGELVPERKFLLPRQEPSYFNPYGVSDFSMCYWPLQFKKGGKKFWMAFAEKWGSSFMVGKLPRNATTAEKAELLDSLFALIQNGVAVVPDDGSIEPLEADGKSASASLYEQLVLHCDREIVIALLGQNQTTEKDSTHASATAGSGVTAELRDADAKLVSVAINQLIKWICHFNFNGAVAPVFSMWDQAAQDEQRAARDKLVYDAGGRFSNKYWEDEYDYAPEHLASPPAPIATPTGAAGAGQGGVKLPPAEGDDPTKQPEPAFAAGDGTNPTQAETDQLQMATGDAWQAIFATLQQFVDQATDLSHLQASITDAYGSLDSTQLVKLMAAAMALAELKGLAAAQAETNL